MERSYRLSRPNPTNRGHNVVEGKLNGVNVVFGDASLKRICQKYGTYNGRLWLRLGTFTEAEELPVDITQLQQAIRQFAKIGNK